MRQVSSLASGLIDRFGRRATIDVSKNRSAVALSMAAVAVAIGLSGCGSSSDKTSNLRSGPGSQGDDAVATSSDSDSQGRPVRLAKTNSDQVVSTLIIPFGPNGLNLSDTQTDANGDLHWVVDMEDREKVDAGVAPLKYLRVKGDLKVPKDAENRPYDIGCLYVEMKDNVYYREKTWLRLSSTGIYGDKYKEVKLPMSVDLGGWQNVPELEDSITLGQFDGNTLKKFTGSLCFRLDFTNAPAQAYSGEIVVQYLKPGATDNPDSCSKNPSADGCKPSTDGGGTPQGDDDPTAPMPFACTTAPMVLKAKQSVDLTWSMPPAMTTTPALELHLSADPENYPGALGTIASTGALTAKYTAPDHVPSNVRILATAKPLNSEALPAFCAISLVSDQDIGVADDGESQGVTGNVYKLASNTQKLPDFSKLTPVDKVIVSNLDIPERDFSTGFPGVKDLYEWFGIQFRGRLIVANAGTCSFKMAADDGAILYIDDNTVVNDDGVHPTTVKTGSANLSKGEHNFRVDYFQGPRYKITLQLFWKCGTDADYTIVPPSAFSRPLQ